MRTIFITSTGTEIGKTLVATSLCWQLQQQNCKVHALKPVITGWQEGDETNDTCQLLKSLDLAVTEENIRRVSYYRFREPLSPDMAARREKKTLDFASIVDFCQAPRSYDYLLIEGIGGIMVPLTEDATICDLMAKLSCSTVLVVGNYLGSLSHTLTALSVLESRSINVISIVVTESENAPVSLQETVNSLKNFTNIPLIQLPRLTLHDKDQPWLKTPPLNACLGSRSND